jgi:hypothetical protein
MNRVWGQKLENGNYVIKVSMGLAILYTPFFLMGHVIATISSYPADGYSVPYAAALILSSLFYFLLGLIILRKFLMRYFSDLAVAVVLLVLSLGTNITIYLTLVPAFSHAYSIFLFSAFLLLTDNWYRKQTVSTSILLGLTTGIIMLIRPTNGIILFVFMLWNIEQPRDILLRFRFFLKQWSKLLLIAVCLFLVWVPQFTYWKMITGYFYYYTYGEEGFFFLQPKIAKVLFSFRKGWLLYTPAMAVALLGFRHLFLYYRKFFWGIIIFFILNLYLISSWWCWWYGGSYGHRAFIDSYPIMAIPLAAIIQFYLQKTLKQKIVVMSFAALFILHNLFQTVKFTNTAIHWDSMSKLAYFETFWKLRPTTLFFDLLEPTDAESALKGLPEKTQPQVFHHLKTALTMENVLQNMDYQQLYYQNFETDNMSLHPEHLPFLNQTVFRSSGTSYELNTSHIYLPGYEVRLNDLNEQEFLFFGADYYLYVNESIPLNSLGLVMSVHDDDNIYAYYFEPADRYEMKMNQWNLRHFIIQRPVTTNNEAIFKCYIWNCDSKAKGYVDDFRVYGIR